MGFEPRTEEAEGMSEFQPETPPPVIVQDEQPVITPPEDRAAPVGPK